jgi:hypothetical protein
MISTRGDRPAGQASDNLLVWAVLMTDKTIEDMQDLGSSTAEPMKGGQKFGRKNNIKHRI